MTSMQLRIVNSVKGAMIRHRQRVEAAMMEASYDAARAAKSNVTAIARSRGLGRLSSAWLVNVYPSRRASLHPTFVILSKSRKALLAFTQGANVSAKSGLWLAVPTDGAPRFGAGRTKITPETFPESRYGRLRFVPIGPRRALLVAENQRQTFSRTTGKARGFRLSRSKKALASGEGLATVPMFVLIRQARINRRLDMAEAAKQAAKSFQAAFLQSLRQGQVP